MRGPEGPFRRYLCHVPGIPEPLTPEPEPLTPEPTTPEPEPLGVIV